MKLSRRKIFGIAIAIVVFLLIIFLSAPNKTPHSGSTYSRAPQGYGAWYAYMLERKFPIQRWEKPLNNNFWTKQKGTLLRIFTVQSASELRPEEKKWIAEGNTIVQLGVLAPVTAANFNQLIENPVGVVQIETTRRMKLMGLQKAVLGDRFGAIVRQEMIGKGRSIQVTTPYLAANAYQDATGNYALLAQLVENNTPIWIDEYLHGYKDKQSMEAQGEGDWVSFLFKTPLLAIAFQGIILLCIVIWAQNQRFGIPRVFETIKTDNSQAYIHSLAAVLARAGANEFVVQAIGQSEKLSLQKRLGLGTKILSHQELLNAWIETGRPKSELISVLEIIDLRQRVTEKQLLEWLEKWHLINQRIHKI